MKCLKIIRKITVKILKIVLLTVITYLAVAGVCAFVIINDEPVNSTRSQTIFVASNGVHVSFVLPTKTDVADWSVILQRPDLANLPYTYIGWGSEAFYTQRFDAKIVRKSPISR